MRFSLILATVDRVEEPRRFLASLDAQKHRDFELIVVDQNPDDRLSPVLAPYASKFDISHIRTEKRGLSRARNIGLENFSGDVIGFPDDDCEYPAGLLDEIEAFFDANPERGGLTGRCVDHDGKTSVNRFDMRAGDVNDVNVWVRAIEGTTFLRAGITKDVWFDETLGVGAGTLWGASEGTDYLIRVLRDGASLFYDPALEVVHPQIPKIHNEKTSMKAYTYGCGMGRVLKKNKSPLWLKTKILVRPLGAVAVYSIRRDIPAARRYFESFKGRLRGLIS